MERMSRRRSRSRSRTSSHARAGDELMIPIYDPDEDDPTIERWTKKVDVLAGRYRWSGDTIMRLIATRLKGHARRWYDARQDVSATWHETRDALKKQFHVAISINERLETVCAYKAWPGQKLGDYCFRKLEKLRKLEYKIRDEDQIDVVIGGIPDTGIARDIRSAKIKDVEELYLFMRRMGNMPSQNGRRRTTPEPSQQDQPSSSIAATSRKEDRNENRTKTSCYNCRRVGHRARDCKEP